MYTIKQEPEDFYVCEILNLPKDSGEFLLFTLTKKDMNTLQAVEILSQKLHVAKKHIGYCGIKDKRAVTTQHVSIKSSPTITPTSVMRIEFPFKLNFIQSIQKPLFIGALKANTFVLTVRNAQEYKLKNYSHIINYFGEQRFSQNNHIIGKHLVKKCYKEAVKLLCDGSLHTRYITQIQTYLQTNSNDYIGALRLIPKQLIVLFTHAYQSHLWNLCAQKLLTHLNIPVIEEIPQTIPKTLHDYKIPILGFDTELERYTNEVQNIVKNMLETEKLTLRNFIQKSMPELTLSGTTRKFCTTLVNCILEDCDSIKKISFTLEKGSYATIALKHILHKKL